MHSVLILAAGLGTRLHPLTRHLAKPAVPAAHLPLLIHATRHLATLGPASATVLNTHHLPGTIHAAANPLDPPPRFLHEPILLDTGGTVATLRDHIPADQTLVVYNGDVLSDIDLLPAWAHHQRHQPHATLILRPAGPNANITFRDGKVVDIRNTTGQRGTPAQFTGISILSPAFRATLPAPGTVFSLVEAWLEALRNGAEIHAILAADGYWSDLGDPNAYLAAHAHLAQNPFPRYAPHTLPPRLHPLAHIAPTAHIDPLTWIGPHATIGENAELTNSVIMENATVAPGARLKNQILPPGQHAGI